MLVAADSTGQIVGAQLAGPPMNVAPQFYTAAPDDDPKKRDLMILGAVMAISQIKGLVVAVAWERTVSAT